MSARRDLLPALTPLRFPAAFGVFIAHCIGLLKGTDGPPWTVWVTQFSAGVTFFFVLSGFILTYNYLDQLRQPTARAVWNFFVARWARTYPVHLLIILAVLPIAYSVIKTNGLSPWRVTAIHLFLGHSFLPEDAVKGNAFNPPSWSLSTEWYFYLCLPLLIPGLTTGSRIRRAAVLLLALAPWLVAVAGTVGLFPLPTWFGPYRYPPVRMVDFVAGVVLGICWHRRHGSTVPAQPSFARATLAEFGALVLLGACLWGVVSVSSSVEWNRTARWIGVYLPPCLLLVWILARNGGLMARVLASRPMTYLGEISYAFYMLHWAVLVACIMYAPRVVWTRWGYGWRWVACGALTFVLAVACYHLYEIPLRNRLRRWLSIRRPEAAPVPATPVEVPAVGEVLPFPAANPTAEGRAA